MRSWVIGRSSECDVVVDSPSASNRHARLTHGPDGLVLEDLQSTSGTYVDSKRITGQTRVTPGQEITIGQTTPMPWPPDLVKFARIGRVEGNEIVLNDLRVSSRHARLMVVAGSEALIEDLGSSNGTFLNSVEFRVTRLTPLSKNDTVYFGSMAVPAATLLAGLLLRRLNRRRSVSRQSLRPSHRALQHRSRRARNGRRRLLFYPARAIPSHKIAGCSLRSVRRRCWRF